MRTFIFLSLFAWSFVACAFPVLSEVQRECYDLVILSGAEPQTLDPAFITSISEERLAIALFEGLTVYDPRDLSPRPGVAESWSLSPDNLTYTFRLRQCFWSNGDPLTAYDFVYSWRRLLEPDSSSQYDYLFFFIKNARAYRNGNLKDFNQVGIRALDARTLLVQLQSPTPFFLDLTSSIAYLPVHKGCVQSYGAKWTRPENIVVNGPFRLAEWITHERIILEKNQMYWDRNSVALERILVLPISDPKTALEIYESGDADWLTTIPPQLVNVLKDHRDYVTSPSLATHLLKFNVARSPFDSLNVRKAFSMAIDRKEITEHVFHGRESSAASFIPVWLPGYSGAEGLPYAPEEARGLLKEVGYTDEHPFPQVELLYCDSETSRLIAEILQTQWKRNLGVDVQLVPQESKVFSQLQKDLEYQISSCVCTGDYADPNAFLEKFVTEEENNRTGWSNARYDELVRLAGLETDNKMRMQYFKEAEKILVEKEIPIAPLFFYVNAMMVKPHIRGIYPNVRGIHPLKWIHVAKEDAVIEHEVRRPTREGNLQPQGSTTDVRNSIPLEMLGWRASGNDSEYDRETLYDYIDGSAEVYLAYDFRRVLVRKFLKSGEPAINVDVFDMGSGEDAFGIFSFEREGADVGIGQGSEYAAGLLRFWKGRFFVSIHAEKETPTSRDAVIAIGNVIAKGLQSEPEPRLLNLLPDEGLHVTSIRYFHTHFGLNYHYFVADENILLLGTETDAVLARYFPAGEKTFLLIVEYADNIKADAARDSFISKYLPEIGSRGVIRLENDRWTGVEQLNEFLIVVFDAPSKDVAENLIKKVRERILADCKN